MSKYTQKFRDAWLNDPELKGWLVSMDGDEGKVAKCKFCVTTICNKLSDLRNHAATKKHQKNAKTVLDKGQPKLQFQSEVNLDTTKTAECRVAMFTACHTAISTTDHLISLCKASFQGQEASCLQMHRTKCSAIIKNVLAPHFINKLKEDIGDGPFSHLIDESTDVSIHKYLGQWRKLHLIPWTSTIQTYSFWKEVWCYEDSQGIKIFKELAYVAFSMLTLPHSNAEVERLFSQMNVVKTKLRNRMKLDTLNSTLLIRSGLRACNKCCHDYPLDSNILKKIKTAESYKLEDHDDVDDLFLDL